MKPGMKMLLMANRGGDNRRSGGGEYERRDGVRSDMDDPYSGYRGDTEYETTRNEYNGSGMNYGGVEGRFRGDGRRDDYHERMNPDSNYGVEDRYETDNRNGKKQYRRDNRGRFMPRNEYMEIGGGTSEAVGNHYPITPLVPPIYENKRRKEYLPMNRIGFNAEEEVNQDYRTSADYPMMNETEHRTSPTMMGYAVGSKNMKLTNEMADEWMEGLQNEDGTKGPHWTFDQTKQVMAQKGVQAEPLDFYVVLNAMYSDYCKVFKKHGVGDKLDFYVDMARAFIDDKDSVGSGKVAAYFENIVNH